MNHTIVELPKLQFIVICVLLTLSMGSYAGENSNDKVQSIELFTSSKSLEIAHSNLHSNVAYTHYEIDQISQLQRELSRGLPKDAEQAKQLVLQRFQLIDAAVSQRLENTAKGLVKAMHYGIDRTPAMVFDGQAVIYGVSDVDDATKRYTQWRERGGR